MVLPVTVIRRGGQEKYLSHTLDLTDDSARLGGLRYMLEPGEIIELQRGAEKAKFQVVWMGAPGSAMEGQSGVRCIEPGRVIWNISLPANEIDAVPVTGVIRDEMPSVRTEALPPGEKRWAARHACSGSASIRAAGSAFPLHCEVTDIARGGIYIDTRTPLPAATEVQVRMNVEDECIEFAGVVRTSYPMVGMGIRFHKVSAETRRKIDNVIQRLVSKAAGIALPPDPSPVAPGPLLHESWPENSALKLEAYPVRVLAMACQTLAENFNTWKAGRSSVELDELRLAVDELQHKLSSDARLELATLFPAGMPRGGHA
jgi:hypothetical protein